MDAATRRNLELDTNLGGGGEHTLMWVLDKTRSAMGSRLLRRWLNRPLCNRAILEQRQQAIKALTLGLPFRRGTRNALQPIGDVERILARVALRSARPRDLARLQTSLASLPALASR